MPLALLVIGFLAIITAIKGNYSDVATQFETDLVGSGGFIYWIAAIAVVGIIARIFDLPDTGKVFIALLVFVFVLSQNGLWTNAQTALSSLQVPTGQTAVVTPSPVAGSSTTQTAGGVLISSTGISASLPGGVGIGLSPSGINVGALGGLVGGGISF